MEFYKPLFFKKLSSLKIRKTLVTVIILLFLTSSFAIAGTLTKLNTTGSHPSVRASSVAAGLSPYIYIFGGAKEDYTNKVYTFYNDLYRLDTKNNVWEKLSPKGDIPLPRGFAAAVADPVNDVIWVFGGANFSFDFSKMTMYDDLWSYSPSKNTWTQVKPTNQGPSLRAKPNMWMVGDKIYLFGGASPNFSMFNDMWLYDTKLNKWTLLIPDGAAGSPDPRDEAQSGTTATSQGKLILYGGEGYSKGAFISYDDTWVYDIKTNKWQNIPISKEKSVLPARHFGVSAVIGDDLFLLGGGLKGVGIVACLHTPFPQRPVGDDLWRFDSIKQTWTKIGACGDAIPRIKRATAASMNGKMYIFFGFDFQCYETNGPGQIWNENDYVYDPSN